MPEEEQKLRERLEKQKLNKKREERERKRILEEERKEKLRSRFAVGNKKESNITCDHNGKPIFIKKININRLVTKAAPRFSYEKVDKGKLKQQKRRKAMKFDIQAKAMFEKNIDPKNIVRDLQLNNEDFINETNSTTFGDVSSVLSLMPGVHYHQDEKAMKGPEFKQGNRMTMKDYKIIAKTRGKVLYFTYK